MSKDLPWSDPVRLNAIGPGIERRLEADEATRQRVAKALDLASLKRLEAEVVLKPAIIGWRLTGRVRADVVQTCGLTLEPLPVSVDEAFDVTLVEEADAPAPSEADIEIGVDDDSPDVVEGVIDLAAYAVEQLALNLDPFPRKPGAVFEPPEGPPEISPFAVLNRLKSRDEGT